MRLNNFYQSNVFIDNGLMKFIKGVTLGGFQTAKHTQELVKDGQKVVNINNAV